MLNIEQHDLISINGKKQKFVALKTKIEFLRLSKLENMVSTLYMTLRIFRE